MSKLMSELNNAEATCAEVNLDVLADLVESQLGNVVGGGYSQYSASHSKDNAN